MDVLAALTEDDTIAKGLLLFTVVARVGVAVAIAVRKSRNDNGFRSVKELQSNV